MAKNKSKCAVCGQNIEDVVRHSHGDEEYHFCSQDCRMTFINSPGDYEKVWKYFRKEGFDSNAVKCAVCGSNVSEEVAVEQEYWDDGAQRRYFFCSEPHRMDFITDPTAYEDMSGKHFS